MALPRVRQAFARPCARLRPRRRLHLPCCVACPPGDINCPRRRRPGAPVRTAMGDLADDVLSNVFWPLLGDGGDDVQGIEDLEARVRRTPRGSAPVELGERQACCCPVRSDANARGPSRSGWKQPHTCPYTWGWATRCVAGRLAGGRGSRRQGQQWRGAGCRTMCRPAVGCPQSTGEAPPTRLARPSPPLGGKRGTRSGPPPALGGGGVIPHTGRESPFSRAMSATDAVARRCCTCPVSVFVLDSCLGAAPAPAAVSGW